MEFINFLSGTIKEMHETDIEKNQDKFQVNLDNILSELRNNKQEGPSNDLSDTKSEKDFSSDDFEL